MDFPASGTRACAPQQAALVSHKWFDSLARHRSSSKPTLRPKSRNLRMRRLFIFLKLARLIQATFWGLPSNPGDDSRAVLHTLVGVLHSAPLGEERSERERGKGTGISAGSPVRPSNKPYFYQSTNCCVLNSNQSGAIASGVKGCSSTAMPLANDFRRACASHI
jgi:hypothetical protein